MGRIGWAGLLVAATLIVASDGYAQQGKNEQPAAQPPVQQAAPPGVAMPDEFKLNLLIRASIVALSQANKTGNYTVLQDLGAPSFRASNDSARLAQIFGHLRARNLDLSPVLFFTPKLVQQPIINPNGILRLVGYFPTEPERVNFDLYFQMLNGDWRIFGIGVSVTPNDQTAALPAQPAASAPAPQDQKPAAASAGEPSKSKPRAAAKKETAAPSQKPKPAETKKQPSATETAVENGTTSNAVRIDLGSQWRAKPE
jgi:hypothetical protein